MRFIFLDAGNELESKKTHLMGRLRELLFPVNSDRKVKSRGGKTVRLSVSFIILLYYYYYILFY